jgi:methylase of polypeptide subunit release factors
LIGPIARPQPSAAASDAALAGLLRLLRHRRYAFVCPTPATHARVVARPGREQARTLTDVLGWSLPFGTGVLDPGIEALLAAAGALEPCGELRRARLRVSSRDKRLFLHSAYPTDDEHAVFFGPDSYRFADLIEGELSDDPPADDARLVDIGAGCGVGGIVAGAMLPGLRVSLTDLNPDALRLARINAADAGIEVETVETRGLERVAGPIDLAVANPPYIIDRLSRLYRDGGGMHGGQVALDMASEAMARLSRGGRLILYTGSAIVDGADELRAALARAAEEHGCTMRYREIDPDVFGEELEHEPYGDVDRIALVAAVCVRQ